MQYAALPYTIVEGKLVILLVTSRRTGRWIFPKGGAKEGQTPWEAAAMEALEEAGVEGEIETQPIGSYRTMKSSGFRSTPIRVDLYPLKVTQQFDAWEEQGERYRHWALAREAKRLLDDNAVAGLITALARKVAPAQPYRSAAQK